MLTQYVNRALVFITNGGTIFQNGCMVIHIILESKCSTLHALFPHPQYHVEISGQARATGMANIPFASECQTMAEQFLLYVTLISKAGGMPERVTGALGRANIVSDSGRSASSVNRVASAE